MGRPSPVGTLSDGDEITRIAAVNELGNRGAGTCEGEQRNREPESLENATMRHVLLSLQSAADANAAASAKISRQQNHSGDGWQVTCWLAAARWSRVRQTSAWA